MSKSKKEMDEEFKRIEEQKAANKAEEYRKQIEEGRNQARAQATDELIQGRVSHKDQQGRDVTHWDQANQLADAAHGGSVRSFDDWRAAMFELMNMYTALNSALTQSVKETITAPIGNALEDYLALPIYDAISKKFDGKPELILPELQHHVHVTDEGKLQIEPLTRADHGKETGNLDQLFEAGIRVWLHDRGYEPKKTADKYEFFDKSGVQLTKDKFEELKNDPDTGLSHYLKDSSDLDFRPRGP